MSLDLTIIPLTNFKIYQPNPLSRILILRTNLSSSRRTQSPSLQLLPYFSSVSEFLLFSIPLSLILRYILSISRCLFSGSRVLQFLLFRSGFCLNQMCVCVCFPRWSANYLTFCEFIHINWALAHIHKVYIDCTRSVR